MSGARRSSLRHSLLLSGLTRAGLALTGLAVVCTLPVGSVHADATPEVPVVRHADGEKLSLELIMSDPMWIGATPHSPYWSLDGETVYYERDRADSDGDRELVRLALNGDGEDEVVTGAAWASVDSDEVTFNGDRSAAVFTRHGDVFHRDLRSGSLRQLTRSAARESNPFFLASGAVAFERGGQFFVREPDGLEWQPAAVKVGEDPSDEELGEDYLSRQQPRLFEVITERQRRRTQARERRTARLIEDPTAPPRTFYLGEKVDIVSRSFSPDGHSLAVITAPEKRDEGRDDKMPEWVTEDGYVNIRDVRHKVGTASQWTHTVTLLDAEQHEHFSVDFSGLPGITDDPLADLRAAAAARQAEQAAGDAKDSEAEDAEAEDAEAEGDDESTKSEPRPVRVNDMRWSPDGARVAFQVHSYDNKDRWLVTVEPTAESAKAPSTVHRLSLTGWIDWNFNEFGWLDNSRLWFLSEATGYSHLYLHDLADASTRQLTEGDMVVSDPTLSPDRSSFYFVANDRHPGRFDVHRVAVDGGSPERLTSLPAGRLTYRLSPDGERLLVRHATTARPPELFVQAAKAGAQARRLTKTVSERFADIDWVKPEIIGVPSSHHDRPIYSRFYPARRDSRLRDASGRIPAVVFVHGAGYLQNAHMGWSGYFREFMFHTLLAESGYHVLDMDYRASAGYGADWRQAIYRHMGQPELEDLQDGVAWLVAEHGVDPERVGVYGGSYGGFMTMMAMFKDPDLFAAGAALRPVTDWAHYNHPYTSNILNTPDIDPEAYGRSSPIEFADGLEKPLLICAPMLDDNVFFLDTVRLAQKFIELGKEDWEVAIYPVEPHGFRRPSSWLDEYRRIFELFEEHLVPDAGS
ncbi:MAG: prolyl oligopeptidase family serine peptidase [Acidobacteriota bacterium]